jgi:hypothetical protein
MNYSSRESNYKPAGRSNYRDNRDNNNRGNNFNKRTYEKYVPTFKKKVPNWKQIESEINELSDKYDQVYFLKCYKIKF